MSLTAWEEAVRHASVTRNGVSLRSARRDSKTLDISLTVPGSSSTPKVRVSFENGTITVQWIMWLYAGVDRDGMPSGFDETLDVLRVAWAEFLMKNPYLPGARGRRPPGRRRC